MAGDPSNRNQNLYCHYHQDHGHATEDCQNLWDHLEQLVREGRLKHLLHHSSGRGGQTGAAFQEVLHRSLLWAPLMLYSLPQGGLDPALPG